MTFAVYVLTNTTRTVLYVGVTSNLKRRLAEHSGGLGEAGKFTGKYQANLLVYFEFCPNADQAFTHEKQLKGWNRANKEALILGFNPMWTAIDLGTWESGSGLGLY